MVPKVGIDIEHSYQHNEQVDGHVDNGAADKHAEVLSDVFDVESEEVGKNQEEDTDRRQLDQEGDDFHHNLLDLSDGTEQRRIGTLDQASNNDGRYENGQKLVISHSANDVVGDLVQIRRLLGNDKARVGYSRKTQRLAQRRREQPYHPYLRRLLRRPRSFAEWRRRRRSSSDARRGRRGLC